MRGEGTSYPPPLLRLKQGAGEEEAHRRRCCSPAVVEAGVVHERVVSGLRVESLR